MVESDGGVMAQALRGDVTDDKTRHALAALADNGGAAADPFGIAPGVITARNDALLDDLMREGRQRVKTEAVPETVETTEEGPPPTREDVDTLASMFRALEGMARLAEDAEQLLRRFAGSCPFATRAAAYAVARTGMETLIGRGAMAEAKGLLGGVCEVEKALKRVIVDEFASGEMEEQKISVRGRTLSPKRLIKARWIDREAGIRALKADPTTAHLVQETVNQISLDSFLRHNFFDEATGEFHIPPELEGIIEGEIGFDLSFVRAGK